MQISANNLLALQQAVGARPREIKPPQPDAFEALFEKPATSAPSSSTQSAQTSPTASAQSSAPAQMGSQLDISV